MAKIPKQTKRKAPRTAFKPGQSGNPNGRPKRKSMTAHLEEALTDDARKKIALAQIAKAKKGELASAEFIFKRIDGNVPQRIDVTARLRKLAEDAGADPDEAEREFERILKESQA